MKTTKTELSELLQAHRPDVTSYDAQDLWGCDGCKWKAGKDWEKRWDEYYDHLAALILEVEQEASSELAWLDKVVRIEVLEECTNVVMTDGTQICSHTMADDNPEFDNFIDSIPTLRVD